MQIPEDILTVAEEVEAIWSNNGASISTRDTLVDGIARAILAERERCAKVADSFPGYMQPRDVAVAIRNGSQPHAKPFIRSQP